MKNILLAVVGLSPQVLTETLFALHQQKRQVDAIHVITTRKGKEKINAFLLAGGEGFYYQYLREYGIAPAAIDFGPANIHTVADGNGIEIDDIWTEDQNEALLKACLQLAFRFTGEKNTAVFFSIAGGRKTMSSCLSLAAQFYGRRQDRLFHVLVSPEFESNRDFYFPPAQSQPVVLYDEKGQPYSKATEFAEINLIHMPFVSLRERLPQEYLSEPFDPPTLLMSLVREEAYCLEVDLVERKLRFKGLEADMMPAKIALYSLFARQKKDCPLERDGCEGCTECYLTMEDIHGKQAVIADSYRRLVGKKDLTEMSDTGIIELNLQNFQSYKSKLKTDLSRSFGLYALRELAIESTGKKPDTAFGLPIDKKRVKLIM